MKRKICVVTGTRAEYGLLYPVMKAIENHPKLKLSLLVTGMHLIRQFGYTIEHIDRDGFTVDFKAPMHLPGDNLVSMAKSLGRGIINIAGALENIRPDIIVVLGDRTEPLAAAMAAAYMNIPIAHIHGGDSSGAGNIDETLRHVITRFAHIHFPATKEHARRLIKMGEEPWRISTVGPLGIYAMKEAGCMPKAEICKRLDLSSRGNIILVVQHPVTTQAKEAPKQMRETLEALKELREQAVVIYPNIDAGGRAMIKAIRKYELYPFIKAFKNLSYLEFISLLRASDVIVGNSSSAIVEAPLFAIPALNLGIRQKNRQKAPNVINLGHERKEILRAIKKILDNAKFRKSLDKRNNPYSVSGNGAVKIADILSNIRIDNKLLQKELTF